MDAEANVGNDAVPAGKSFDKMTDEEIQERIANMNEN